MIRRLFFDIETSPNIVYSWRIGSKITLDYNNIIKERAIICVCWKWAGEDHVWSLRWNNGNDADMLREFIEVLNDSEEAIAHNGDRFDIKWLRTRCIKHGIPTFPTYKTIDTLKLARSNFYFNSNRLDYIAKYLGLKGKTHTNFDLWKKVMAGDKRALSSMVAYCENDVIQLEEIYNELSRYCNPKTNIAILEDGPRWACSHCASKKVQLSKKRISAMGIMRFQMQCCKCNKYYTLSSLSYNKFLEEK